MKPVEILGVIGGTMIPILGVLWHISTKWTRMEMRLAQITDELRTLTADKDRTHSLMLDQMTKDRDATDKRLRYLERYLWPYIGNQEGRRPNAV